MKNIIWIIGLLVISPAILTAQDTTITKVITPTYSKVELGFRLMPTLSAFDITTLGGGTVKGQVTFGYGIGGMLAINFTNHQGFQGEVIYNSLSQKFKDEDIDREINVRYVNIPLLYSLNSGKSKPVNINLVAGPQFGYNLGSSIKSSGGSGTDTVVAVIVTKRSDFGVAYGGGLEFLLNPEKSLRMDMGLRGVYGLININDNSPEVNEQGIVLERAKVRTVSGYLGLTLLF